MKALGGKILTIMGVAAVWLAFFELNALVFAQFEHSSRAHWVFLPAALRVLSVLLFRGEGAAGLVVGAYLTLPHDPASSLAYELSLSISSAVAPLAAIWFCRQFFPIAPNLAGLRGKHIITLSVANAAVNSVVINMVMAVAGKPNGNFEQMAAIFVGDMLGAAILLALLSWVLRLVVVRKPIPTDQTFGIKGGHNGS